MNNISSFVFISDSNYLPITAVALTSMLENKLSTSTYEINLIITDDVNSEDVNKIKTLEKSRFKINIIKSLYNSNDFFLNGSNVSPAAINKFFIAETLSHLKKVLYLDGDIIVNSDLSDLYNMDLENYYAAVAKDIDGNKGKHLSVNLHSDLEIYFNSGVMLLNLEKLRNDNMRHKLLEYRKNGRNFFMDQDALNICFNGNVKYFSCEYNYMITVEQRYLSNEVNLEYQLPDDTIGIERISNAKIIHLAGKHKPWNEHIAFFSDLFEKYYRKSPFATENLFPEINVIKIGDHHYIFPFELVEKGCNIVLYGAGKVGEQFLKQIKFTNFCNIICWVDASKKNKMISNMEIQDPTILQDIHFDKIVIAIDRESIASDIKNFLKELKIDDKKIVWRKPLLK